jgi:glycosyltransferase involved in cell wall biosynthesis
VGGGVFGGSQTSAWRALGLDARLHYAVELADYWKAKSGFFSRLRLRWKMYASYPLSLWRTLRAARPRATFVAVTNPFFLPALAASTGRKRGLRVVQLVYDLYPDALIFGGGWSPRHPAARLAAWTTRIAIARCAATVYLGARLRRHAERHYGVAPQTAVIPVGTDTSVFRGCAPQPREKSPVRLLYSGHLGQLHDWETVSGAVREGLPSGVEMEIAADGPGAGALKRALASSKVIATRQLVFAGTRNAPDWKKAMLGADVALVTMRPGAEKVVMPSKTYSAMAAGQAVLAVCPRESDLADLILDHDCGWVIEPGDAAGLQGLLAHLSQAGDEILCKRRRAWEAAHAHYSMEAVGRQWLALFKSLDES